MPTAMRVLFICLGSINSGLGHVHRSRTVALAMKEFATVKMVVVGDGCSDNLLVDRGLDYVLVDCDQKAWNEYQSFQPEIVYFDTLHFDPEIFRRIHACSLTVSLSPIFNLLMENHIIFHRTKIINRSWSSQQNSPVVYSGLGYAVVNERCQVIPEDIYSVGLQAPILSLAISMGGTDAANKTFMIIENIKSISSKLLVWILLGEGYSHSYQEIVDCMRGSHHEIILAKTNDSMWRILNACSLAILAGGTTTYEAAFSCLPSINILERTESYFLIQELVEAGVCKSLATPFPDLGELCPLITELNQNREKLMEMHQKARSLLDQFGARRIVDETLRFFAERASESPILGNNS